MKKGRNAPCPCGSGKKYKKCCLNKDQQQTRMLFNNDIQTKVNYKIKKNPPQAVSNEIRPYVIAKMCEPENSMPILNKMPALTKRLKNQHLPSNIRPLSTNEIIQQLSKRNVEFDETLFIERSQKFDSAWELSESLWPTQARSKKDISDFCCLAACILWERFYDENKIKKPSFEMIDDFMENGYKAKNDNEKIDLWMKAWTGLKSLYDIPKYSVEQLDQMFNGTQSLYNWMSDFELDFINASIDNKEIAKKGVIFLNEVVSFFADEKELIKLYQRSLAELYCNAGEFEKGEQLAKKLLASYPEDTANYVVLDTVISLKPSVDKESNLKERLQVLMNAKEYPVTNGPDYDLDARIFELQEQLQKIK